MPYCSGHGGQAGWQLLPGGRWGPAGLGRLANWAQCGPLLGSRTCGREKEVDLRPGLLLVPGVVLPVHSFLSSSCGHLIVWVCLWEHWVCRIFLYKKDSVASKFGKVLGSNFFLETYSAHVAFKVSDIKKLVELYLAQVPKLN